MHFAFEYAAVQLIHQGVAFRALDGTHLIRSVESLTPALFSFIYDIRLSCAADAAAVSGHHLDKIEMLSLPNAGDDLLRAL